jgi:sortase A
MRVSLKSVNDGLLVVIVVVNACIIAAPFIPKISFWWQSQHTQRMQQLNTQVHEATKPAPATSQPDHVVIPAMLLDTSILEGTVANQYKTLDKGIWRWPHGSTPDKGGNTVLIGHRFTYTNPRGIFYFLNKIKPGDEIGVWWHNNRYVYRVSETKVVHPTDTAIEANTSDARLTLFTCTPLWLPKDRLVVVAELEKP